jgi:ligand-binding sensor domain-containing protein
VEARPFRNDPCQTLLPGRALVSIAASKNEDVWLGTRDAGLLRVHGGRTETITNQMANCLLVMANQELYVGTNQGLTRWDGSGMTTAGIPDALTRIPILALAEDHDSNVWIGTEKGLLRLNSQGQSHFGEAGSEKKITAIFEDREGDLWTGSTDGIERLQDSPVITYHSQNRQEWEHGGPIHVDSAGRVWAAPAGGGIYSLNGGALKEVLRAVVGHDGVYSIAGDGESLWLGSKTRGLIHIDEHGKSRAFTQADGLPQNSIYAVHRNKDGTIWCGTLTGGVSHFQDGHFTNYSTAQGLASDTILSITDGADGTMWFGTPLGLSSFAKEHWRTYGIRDGLPSENIVTLFEDDSRILWMGTLHGLAFLRAGRVFIPAGLPPPLLGQIFGITQDRFGSLWIATPEALIRVNRAKLLSGPLERGDFREFGVSDGINEPAGIRREHAIATSSDGRVWLSRNQGVSELDPARLQRTAVRSIVHIERVLVDGEP